MIFKDKKITGEIETLKKSVVGLQTAICAAKNSNKELRKRIYELEQKLTICENNFDNKLKDLTAAVLNPQSISELSPEVMKEWMYSPRIKRGGIV